MVNVFAGHFQQAKLLIMDVILYLTALPETSDISLVENFYVVVVHDSCNYYAIVCVHMCYIVL